MLPFAAATLGRSAKQGILTPLFKGKQGFWYDPSDLGSMWQDSGKTAPAAVGSPVGYIQDKSGNKNHAFQATAGKRPILRSSGGLNWLEFDGVDDYLSTNAFVFGDGTTASIAYAAQKSSTAVGLIAETSPSTSSNSGSMYATINDSGTLSCGMRGAAGTIIGYGNNVAVGATFVGVFSNDTSNTSGEYIRINGVSQGGNSSGNPGGAGSVALNASFVGARGGTSAFFNGRLYELFVRSGMLTSAEITKVEGYFQSKSGISF